MTKKTLKTTGKIKKAEMPVKTTAVQQMDLHQAFNLTDVSHETLASYAFYLKEMVNSAGWKLMVQVLEGNLALLEKQIVRKKEVLTDRPLTESEADSLRDQHEILTELINKPHQLIKKYGAPEQARPVVEYDPYGGNRKTINASTMSDMT